MRIDGRANDELRHVEIIRHFLKHPEGSVLIRTGDTMVVCTATVEEGVPNWLTDSGKGWVTAEYGMLPRATPERTLRNRTGGREYEIQRLIGRSLRAAVDLKLLDGYTVTIDCDVLQADGGTRTASITGGYIALYEAIHNMLDKGILEHDPIIGQVAAVSVGIVGDEHLLDLCYSEDSTAIVDMNVVMRGNEFVEVQGTGEGGTYNRVNIDAMLDLAAKGIEQLMYLQRQAIES